MRPKDIFIKFLSFLPYLFVFIGSLYGNQDPDLGWHLKYGEYFIQHGAILRDNIFSTLMPNFHWANGSWGTDIITYLIFHFTGFLGLTLFSSFIVILTFYFVSKTAKFTLLDQMFLFPLLLYLEQVANLFPFKGQQLSLLFIVILFLLINLFQTHQEIVKRVNINPLLFAIPLFLVWANIHEEFLLGLGLFFLWTFIYLGQKIVAAHRVLSQTLPLSKNYRKIVFTQKLFNYIRNDRKEILQILIIFMLSFAATIINPFGWGVHLDALSHFRDPLLKYVVEYASLSTMFQLFWSHVVFGVLLVISLIILFFSRSNFGSNIPNLIIVIFLYIFSFGVMRYSWPTYYLGILFLKPIIDVFKINDNKRLIPFETFGLFLLVIIIIILKQPFNRYTQFSWIDYYYCWELCSNRSAEFLEKNNLTQNIYTLYDWGGWLIWNYPQIKPTIDGRMHLWRDKNGYSGFADYLAYEQNWKDIDSSSYNVVYISKDKPIYKHMIKLSNEGKWVLVYRDELATIFIRNTPAQWKIIANPTIYGKYLLSTGKTNEAKQQFALSISQNPGEWEAYHTLAVIYQKEKNYNKAKALETQAIKYNPTNTNLIDNFATLIYLSEPPENTISFTSEKLEKFPKDWKLNVLMALGYYRKGGSDTTALKYAQKAYSIKPNQITFEVLERITNGEDVEALNEFFIK